MQKGAHTQYDIQIHVVWLTKYRKRILTEKIALRLKELLIQGCSAKGITINKRKYTTRTYAFIVKYTLNVVSSTGNTIPKGKKFKKIARRI